MYGLDMEEWNIGWMWMLAVVVIIALAPVLRARGGNLY
jgi:hypothetical protein